jgi:NAD(P)-dependent dehydrogenase (short-subunit alcohol dehydrogenase family)
MPDAPGTLIVTGAGRGIGAAVARLAAARGWAVAVNCRSTPDEAAAVVRAIRDAGGRAEAVVADVGDAGAVRGMFDRAEAALGPVRGLVLNAGITGGMARVDAVDPAVVAEVMRVNVVSCFLCAGEAVRRMSTARGGPGGAVVAVSSMAARLGGAGEWVHYAASKGAVDAFVAGLSKEVAAEGIRVNAVAPGLIQTGIHAAAGAPDRLERLSPGTPMRRPGTAEEVAEAVAWLLSDAASYVTGAVVPVAGGR